MVELKRGVREFLSCGKVALLLCLARWARGSGCCALRRYSEVRVRLESLCRSLFFLQRESCAMSVGESEAAMSRGETGWEEGSGGPCPKGAAPEEAESSSKEKDEAIGDFDEKACVNDGVAPSASESTESPSEPATKEGVEAPAAANSASDDLAEETARVCAAWGGEEGQSVAAWLRREGLAGIHELLVEALLTPTPKTNAGALLRGLPQSAASSRCSVDA